jgi:hypothetical protein
MGMAEVSQWTCDAESGDECLGGLEVVEHIYREPRERSEGRHEKRREEGSTDKKGTA